MPTQRNIAVCIILSIVTCGIYGLYWFICITNEVNTLSNEEGTSGGIALLLTIVTCNIYGIYWGYKMGEKLDAVRARYGQPAGSLSTMYLVICIFCPIVTYALVQNELNKYAPQA